MLGSREEAEDAVQHTFMAAYTDLRRSDKPIQLRPWLYTIARDHCMSLLRARREQAPLDDAEPSVDGLAATVQRRKGHRATCSATSAAFPTTSAPRSFWPSWGRSRTTISPKSSAARRRR